MTSQCSVPVGTATGSTRKELWAFLLRRHGLLTITAINCLLPIETGTMPSSASTTSPSGEGCTQCSQTRTDTLHHGTKWHGDSGTMTILHRTSFLGAIWTHTSTTSIPAIQKTAQNLPQTTTTVQIICSTFGKRPGPALPDTASRWSLSWDPRRSGGFTKRTKRHGSPSWDTTLSG